MLPCRSNRRAIAVVAALLLVLALGACQPATAEPLPSDGHSGGLPGPLELLPPGFGGAMAWTPLTAYAEAFDVRAAYDSPRAVADAFGDALLQGYPSGPDRPRLLLEPAVETDSRAILVITEAGNDDPVIGAQHALVMVEGTGEWYVTSSWSRTLCVDGLDPTGSGCT